jgi:hypothetical protein
MMRSALLLVVALLSGDRLAAQEAGEARGITSSIKLEETVYSHIEELNGKFKMRASEATFAPGAHLGAHHHVAPEFDMCFPASLRSRKVGRLRSIMRGITFLKRETSHIVLTIRRTSRFGYCP